MPLRPLIPAGAFEVTKRIAWLLCGEGGGLWIKNGGENIVSWKGCNFAAARICYPDGHYYRCVRVRHERTELVTILVDRSPYVPAIDPRCRSRASKGKTRKTVFWFYLYLNSKAKRPPTPT